MTLMLVHQSAHMCRYLPTAAKLLLPEKRMRKISVLLSEGDEARFCAYCVDTGHKKSTLIAHLIKEHLDSEKYRLSAPGVRRSVASQAPQIDHQAISRLPRLRRKANGVGQR
jgi:hypothetical protein